MVLSNRNRLQRGFATSTMRALREIGLTRKERNRTVNEVSDVAENASRWIWLKDQKTDGSQIANMSLNRKHLLT